MKRSILKVIVLATVFSLLMAGVVSAGPHGKANKLRITITNVTKGQIFSPPIVITHNSRFTLFTLGESPSPGLALLAEDGDPSLIIDAVSESPDAFNYVVADGPVLPGSSLTIDIDMNRRFRQVSLAGMLVTTNDAFVGLRSSSLAGLPWRINHVKALAYDAGSEANSEDCAFIPGPPCGNGGVRDTDGAEGFVHIHSGIHGTGDLLPERDDWRNPVAEITIQLVNE